jgi:hypothetical protein
MSDDTDTSVPSQAAFRFSLKTLLLLALMIALCLGAFQYGRQVGFAAGDRSGFAAGLIAKPYLVVYPVGNIVGRESVDAQRAACQSLIDEIIAKVQPQSWEQAGGPGRIAYDPRQDSLIVNQTGRGHDAISAFLEPLRIPQGNVQIATSSDPAVP